MKRPHSAKPTRNHHQQNIHDDVNILEQSGRHFVKLNKKNLNHLLSASNDLSRMLPKHIQQDKERLYYQTLQLKNSVNEITQQNLRLKTKVAILQRQKDRMNKTQEPYLKKGGKSGNVLGLSINKNEKQNGVVFNLKKIIRQAKQQNQSLKTELIKLKRTMRYTKINELQTEKLTIYEQNKQLSNKIQKLIRELQNRVRQEEQTKAMDNNMKELTYKLKEVTTDNIKYEELLEEIEIKYKEISEKFFVSQQKWQRSLTVEKRKNEQMRKQNESLAFSVKNLNEKLQEQKKKASQNHKKLIRPTSSHPYKQSSTGRPQSSNTNKLNQSNVNQSRMNKEKEDALCVQDKLQRQLQQARKKLKESQNKLKITGKDEIPQHSDSKEESLQFILTKNQYNQYSNNNQINEEEEEEYAEDFQKSPQKKSIKNVSHLPINQKEKKSPQKRSSTQVDPLMNEIRQILTYRMKYNRYPFDQLKSDIEVSPLNTFDYSDLVNMLTGEPFFLTQHYVTHFLKHCYKQNKIKENEQLPSKVLISNLRKVIEDFQLMDQEEEESCLYKIADFLTKNREKIEKQCEKVKHKDNTISKDRLIQVINKYKELNPLEIDLAISYISIHCQNLSNINFHEFLDKLYINNSKEMSPMKASKDMDSPVKMARQEDELSFGSNQDQENGELIGDDQLI